MTIDSTARISWHGTLESGSGTATLPSSNTSLPVNWKARSVGETHTTTPEELLAAAHAACFAMALTHELTQAGHTPESVDGHAIVSFQPGLGVTASHLDVKVRAPGISPEDFNRLAEVAKTGCPISQALSIPVTLNANLV